MTYLEQLLERNKEYAAGQSAAGTLMPSLPQVTPKTTIISCVDMRVDPADLLGTKPGEAVVLRNIGGRVTPGVIEELGMLRRVSQVARGGLPAGGGEYHLIVLQHTDCGITRLEGDPVLLTHFFQIQEGEGAEGALAAKAVMDPRAAVVADVATLRAVSALPAAWLLSGLVYDVATGLVEVVVPAAPIRGE
jgi:carbonic anhydrase